ncbi:MAG: sigma-54-dependent Fis family transcriptional regulator, partial [Planctomycetes bacterium]|nr:sigma-54-dependent Fis family transcriptional regulator [Planctomycetota bacterium]
GRHDLETLRSHDWPGNVRELQNVMERYVISGRIGIDDFSAGDEAMPHGDDDLLDGSLEAIETRIIRRILESEGYNKTSTAKRLGISRTTLDKKIRSTDSSRF